MGYFLGLAANSGVQLIVETHSDHVINGVRRCVAANDLSSNDVALHFFRNSKDSSGSPIAELVPLAINEKGRISDWPKGFFDQIQKDLLDIP